MSSYETLEQAEAALSQARARLDEALATIKEAEAVERRVHETPPEALVMADMFAAWKHLRIRSKAEREVALVRADIKDIEKHVEWAGARDVAGWAERSKRYVAIEDGRPTVTNHGWPVGMAPNLGGK